MPPVPVVVLEPPVAAVPPVAALPPVPVKPPVTDPPEPTAPPEPAKPPVPLEPPEPAAPPRPTEPPVLVFPPEPLPPVTVEVDALGEQAPTTLIAAARMPIRYLFDFIILSTADGVRSRSGNVSPNVRYCGVRVTT
jgi:hypothetical protein